MGNIEALWRDTPSLLTYSSEDGAEEDGQDDEPGVPVVVLVDGGDAQEHEDDRLGGR